MVLERPRGALLGALFDVRNLKKVRDRPTSPKAPTTVRELQRRTDSESIDRHGSPPPADEPTEGSLPATDPSPDGHGARRLGATRTLKRNEKPRKDRVRVICNGDATSQTRSWNKTSRSTAPKGAERRGGNGRGDAEQLRSREFFEGWKHRGERAARPRQLRQQVAIERRKRGEPQDR
jgi:hypothetical protein